MKEQNVFTDDYLKERLNHISEVFQQGHFPCNWNGSYGCLVLKEVGKKDFGSDEIVGVGKVVRDRNQDLDIVIPFPGIKLPKILEEYQPAVAVEATLDPNTNRVEIIHGEEIYSFTNVMAWQSGRDILEDINKELERKDYGILCWKLRILDKKENMEDSPLFDGPIPRFSNGQTNLLMSGYAFEEHSSMVYCSVAGHKTEIYSMQGSLYMRRPLSINVGRRSYTTYSAGKYEPFSHYLGDIGTNNAGFIAHKAIPGKWDPEDTEIYAVVFKGVDDAESALHKMVLSRLQEALDYPLMEEWAGAIFEKALDKNYIFRLITGGDCLAGARIVLEKDWKGLIEEAFAEKIIAI